MGCSIPTVNKTEIVPIAIPPYGAPKSLTISMIGEKSVMKFWAAIAVLWAPFDHSPHPASWL